MSAGASGLGGKSSAVWAGRFCPKKLLRDLMDQVGCAEECFRNAKICDYLSKMKVSSRSINECYPMLYP